MQFIVIQDIYIWRMTLGIFKKIKIYYFIIRILFLANVLIGDYYECNSNSALLRPPNKPNSIKKYDSVKSFGDEIYIIYNNNKAYPLYLLKYKK